MSEVRDSGLEKLPHARSQGQRLRGATPCPRSGAAAERSYPTSKKQWLHGRRRAERSYSTFKVRRGGCEEIPLLQGKEQRLRFAGAAAALCSSSHEEIPHVQGKRNPSKTVGVARGIRGQTHKP